MKPAVGVFDLASRATEGIRHTALHSNTDYQMNTSSSSSMDGALTNAFKQVSQSVVSGVGTGASSSHFQHAQFMLNKRLSRVFRSGNIILPFSIEHAAVQYLVDRLNDFRRDYRFHVLSYQHIQRQIQFTTSQHHSSSKAIIPRTRDEAWGMQVNNSYIAVVSTSYIGLIQVKSPFNSTCLLDVSFVWSCPTSCVRELFSDPRTGDLIIHTNQSLIMTGSSSVNSSSSVALSSSSISSNIISTLTSSSPYSSWNHISHKPIVMDEKAQDYLIFQLVLEQTIGRKLARDQALYPRGGFVDTDVYRRQTTGFKSLMYAPTRHTYQLVGHVLYEYTASTSSSTHGSKDAGSSSSSSSSSEVKYPNDYYYTPIINQLYGYRGTVVRSVGSNNSTDDTDENIRPDGYLSFVYPLVDISISGPVVDDMNGKYSISIQSDPNIASPNSSNTLLNTSSTSNQSTYLTSNLTGLMSSNPVKRMRVLRREAEDSLLSEYNKTILTLVFSNRERALSWKMFIEKHMLTCNGIDMIEHDQNQATGRQRDRDRDRHIDIDSEVDSDIDSDIDVETEKKSDSSTDEDTRNNNENNVFQRMDSGINTGTSILEMLVIPSSGIDPKYTENLKIEIAKTLSFIG